MISYHSGLWRWHRGRRRGEGRSSERVPMGVRRDARKSWNDLPQAMSLLVRPATGAVAVLPSLGMRMQVASPWASPLM